jgi:hypothetical protein
MLSEAVNASDKEKVTAMVAVAKASLPFTASVTPNVDVSLLQTYLQNFISNKGIDSLIDLLKN